MIFRILFSISNTLLTFSQYFGYASISMTLPPFVYKNSPFRGYSAGYIYLQPPLKQLRIFETRVPQAAVVAVIAAVAARSGLATVEITATGVLCVDSAPAPAIFSKCAKSTCPSGCLLGLTIINSSLYLTRQNFE